MNMLKVVLVVLTLMISGGCTTNGLYDPNKTWLLVGAVAVGGVIASQQSDNDHTHKQNCSWAIGPNGSTQVCR